MAAAVLACVVLVTGILSAGSSTVPQPATVPTEGDPVPDGKRATGLEALFHGTWKSGSCIGELTLKPDGTYQRKNWSPGNNTLSGKWSVRWDALPPTLVMTCEASDDKDNVGRTWEMKVLRLDTEILEYQIPKTSPKAHSLANFGLPITSRGVH